ncbi:lipopolysaccharide heptosyltransferase II [Azorhizobium oxalatiphilum]|uniref:lipopolysaccharide heptosyltransferase II n=1 Tax=Azorhizobium oxalatiphilum TaxID=980631 RepID=A0A917BV91_9HYPH|nr:lipopolysaccharide heptosyltransferase II [Azorhizobium oxalatiphilum]GGF59915.1 lipopolysaccharide heptosyltransferase II [Azorhizobium oxalatiphilum]
MRAIGTYSPILIVGPSWVGDMVMAASLVASLKAQDPGRPIDMMAPKAALPVAQLIPGVRRTIPLGLGHGEFGFLARWRAGRALKDEGYGKAIILPRAFKAAIAPFAAGIPERIGYAAEGRSILLTDARPDTFRKTARTIDRFVALGLPEAPPQPSERPVLNLPEADRIAIAQKFPLAGLGPVMALCPGAEYGPAKRWPARKFAQLAAQAHAAGYQIRVLGGPKDAPLAQEIVEKAGVPVEDLVGRTSLVEAAGILAAAEVVISNDSGLMHVAGALDRPLVVLYGSSSEKMTPPTGPHSVAISHDVSCRPCFKRECPLGTLACFEAIRPQEVLAAAMAVQG